MAYERFAIVFVAFILWFVDLQAILAGSFAEKDYNKTTAAATRTLQFGFILGAGLSLIVGFGLYFGAGIFSKNLQVIHFIRIGAPVGFMDYSISYTPLFLQKVTFYVSLYIISNFIKLLTRL